MRTYSTNQPIGGDPQTTFAGRQHKVLQAELQFYDTPTVKWQITSRGIRANAKTSPGGGPAEKRWQTPKKELDPTKSVKKGTWVYISPLNSLATAGLTDLVSGMPTKSPPGIWEAAQNVPAENAQNQYNVPQLPYPGSGGVPAGKPLAGDLDGPKVFWILISSAPVCF